MARGLLEVSGGSLRSPRRIHGHACDLWNYPNRFEIYPKADSGQFAKELPLLQIYSKTGDMLKTKQSSILSANVDKLTFAGGF